MRSSRIVLFLLSGLTIGVGLVPILNGADRQAAPRLDDGAMPRASTNETAHFQAHVDNTDLLVPVMNHADYPVEATVAMTGFVRQAASGAYAARLYGPSPDADWVSGFLDTGWGRSAVGARAAGETHEFGPSAGTLYSLLTSERTEWSFPFSLGPGLNHLLLAFERGSGNVTIAASDEAETRLLWFGQPREDSLFMRLLMSENPGDWDEVTEVFTPFWGATLATDREPIRYPWNRVWIFTFSEVDRVRIRDASGESCEGLNNGSANMRGLASGIATLEASHVEQEAHWVNPPTVFAWIEDVPLDREPIHDCFHWPP